MWTGEIVSRGRGCRRMGIRAVAFGVGFYVGLVYVVGSFSQNFGLWQNVRYIFRFFACVFQFCWFFWYFESIWERQLSFLGQTLSYWFFSRRVQEVGLRFVQNRRREYEYELLFLECQVYTSILFEILVIGFDRRFYFIL